MQDTRRFTRRAPRATWKSRSSCCPMAQMSAKAPMVASGKVPGQDVGFRNSCSRIKSSNSGWRVIRCTLNSYVLRPLHEAAENGATELVRLLLSYGADPLLATYSGQTPLMLAVDTEANSILEQHLDDIQGRTTVPWSFAGPASIFGTRWHGIVTMRDYEKSSAQSTAWIISEKLNLLRICLQIRKRRASIH